MTTSLLRLSTAAALVTVRRRRRTFSVVSALDGREYLQAIRAAVPGLERQAHRNRGLRHAHAASAHAGAWGATADQAAQETFGRRFEVYDYRISGVGRDEFSEAHKSSLRHHARAQSLHASLAIAHFMAAGHRFQTALRLFREARAAHGAA